MKVLFLDIDGVCNCRTSFHKPENGWIVIDPYMAFLVGKIQLDTDCEVVLSSSWRYTPEGREAVEKRIVKLYDCTPMNHGFRGDEVNEWLRGHPEVTRHAILDDDSDFHKTQPLFKTDWETGLTKEIADKVTEFLNA